MHRLLITLLRRQTILWEGGDGACEGISVGAESLGIPPEEDGVAAVPVQRNGFYIRMEQQDPFSKQYLIICLGDGVLAS